jgi:prephenate dehydratase
MNLTFIQSRPTVMELGHHNVIIDTEGHIEDKAVADTLAGLKAICEDIRFLGSYPQAK